MKQARKSSFRRNFGDLRGMLALTRGNRLQYLWAIISVGVASLMGYAMPLIVRVTVDSVIDTQPFDLPQTLVNWIEMAGGREAWRQNLWVSAVILVAMALIGGLFTYFRGRYTAKASEGIAQRLRDRLYGHLQTLSYDYHVKAETGDLIQRCTSDVETIRRFLAVQVIELVRGVFMVGIAVAILLPISPKLTGISLIMVPPMFLFSLIYFVKVQQRFRRADEAEGEMSTVLQENLTGMRVVRAFGQQAYEVEKFDRYNRTNRDLYYKLMKLMGFYWGFSDYMGFLQIGISLTAGVAMTVSGEITLGSMLVFTSYSSMMLWPVRQLGRILADMGKAMVSFERLQQILTQPSEPDDGVQDEQAVRGDIVFDHVWFGYEKDKPVLRDVSFTAKVGETIAILGATGSGKSSLVHLLQRLYDYDKGEITLGGRPIRQLNRKWLRRRVGIVLQEPFLFSKTIRENIGITKRGAGEDEIIEAARIAAVHEVITSFDQGYETPVGERGVTLSGGQKQRVAIARMLMQNAPILIFDDSLSAVDTQTDATIRAALQKRRRGVTTFIISHRINTLSEADQILVLEEGRIVQRGTHETLLGEEGLYRRIWALQEGAAQEA
ncbi:ABC transporter ATP-binding protein [Luoshenia tenuis]|nr:ABC transporter ATP-binding protein [Luoshenia tenuis]